MSRPGAKKAVMAAAPPWPLAAFHMIRDGVAYRDQFRALRSPRQEKGDQPHRPPPDDLGSEVEIIAVAA